MADMMVATEILRQLGGRRFVVMTGARDVVGGDRFLMFRLPKAGKDGANKVKITLTAADDYTVETFFVRGVAVKPKSSRDGIYCDALVSVFESLTGYAARL